MDIVRSSGSGQPAGSPSKTSASDRFAMFSEMFQMINLESSMTFIFENSSTSAVIKHLSYRFPWTSTSRTVSDAVTLPLPTSLLVENCPVFHKLLTTVWRCLDNTGRRGGQLPSNLPSGWWIPHLWQLHCRSLSYESPSHSFFEPICTVVCCFPSLI